jgi:uncharacterized membrane protein
MSEHRTQEETDEAEWTSSANWRWGLFYYSAKDSRDWVPKRAFYGRRRFGGTPNFAKPGARQYMMLIVGAMLAVFFLIVMLERIGVLK